MLTRTSVALAGLAFAAFSAFAQPSAENPTTPPPKPERQTPQVEKHLKVFDTLALRSQAS